MTIITMTREMGSRGKDVARDLADRLGFNVIHHELVAEDDVFDDGESEVWRHLESTPDEIDGWRTRRAGTGRLTSVELIEIALEGEAIIRGWGATRLFRDVPGVLHVRVCAPMEMRVATVAERLDVDARTARREIDRSDAAHGQTFLRFFRGDWRDPGNYNVILDTAQSEPADCADLLAQMARSTIFTDTGATANELSRMLARERVQETLRSCGLEERRGARVDAIIAEGEVRLYGTVAHQGHRAEIEQEFAGKPWVNSVRNDIFVVSD